LFAGRLHVLRRAVGLACLLSLVGAASASADDTLSLSVPAGAVEDVQTTITATWTSDDDSPWLALFVKPGVGGGCAVGPFEEDVTALRISAERPPTLDPAVKSWTPHEPGPYTVSRYVRDDDFLDYTVASFELNVRAPAASVASLTVSVAPDPCVQAVAALTAAPKTSSRADARVRSARSAYKRADRATKRAHGKSRVRLPRRASRKRAALRRTITAKVAACGG
jgi:hypothetical protein